LALAQDHIADQASEFHPLDEASRATSSDTGHARLAMNAEGTEDSDQ